MSQHATPTATAAATADWSIDLHDVTKVYKRKVRALDQIEMQVGRGEIFGLLGPNGAGKSTLVKIMLTIVRPTHAQGNVLGHRLGHRRTLTRVGYLPEDHRFPPHLTGRQVLTYYGALGGVSTRRERRKRADRLLGLVAMERWADRPVREYSKGMLQRVGLAQALMNDPDLVILDEPTDGVDPVGRREIREVLRQIRDEGRTIFLNSHLLSEVEMLCSRVAILVQGTVRTIGSIDDLTRDSQRFEVEIVASRMPEWVAREFPAVSLLRASDTPPVARPSGDAPPPGEAHATVDANATTAGTLTLSWPSATVEGVQPLIDRLRQSGVAIRRVQPRADTLEDLFIRLVADDQPGAADHRRGNGSAKATPVAAAPPTS